MRRLFVHGEDVVRDGLCSVAAGVAGVAGVARAARVARGVCGVGGVRAAGSGGWLGERKCRRVWHTAAREKPHLVRIYFREYVFDTFS